MKIISKCSSSSNLDTAIKINGNNKIRFSKPIDIYNSPNKKTHLIIEIN